MTEGFPLKWSLCVKIKVVIVEDEIYSLERLIKMLSSYNDIDIVGSAEDGESAVEIINNKRPDVVFLDIELPVYNGFEVIKRLNYKPKVVFVTAYDSYATKAFEVNGVDYIMKPVEGKRLEAALNKVRKSGGNVNDDIIELILKAMQKKSLLKRFSVRKEDDIIIIPEDEVVYFKAEDKYVFLCTYDKEFFYDATLKELEDKLDPDKFIRIHRAYIVSMDKIVRIKKWFLGEYRVELSNKDKITLKISRSYIQDVRKRLNF